MAQVNSSSPALLIDPAVVNGSSSSSKGGGVGSSIGRVHVHPLVLLSILDHHNRRQENAGRVIGTLLGRRDVVSGFIEVTNCFAVPHAEDGVEVAIGKDFNRQMLALHTRANPKEIVVGWYATALPPPGDDDEGETEEEGGAAATGGADGKGKTTTKKTKAATTTTTSEDRAGYKRIADTSSLIHEFYAGECVSAASAAGGVVAAAAAAAAGGGAAAGAAGDPVHLVLDTSLALDTLGLTAYRSTPVTIRGEAYANMFHELDVRVTSGESEKICVDRMVQALGNGGGNGAGGGGGGDNWRNPQGGDIDENEDEPTAALQSSMTKLLQLLEVASSYVDPIADGSKPVPSDDALGRELHDALASVPRVREEIFDDMFHDNLQDLLMVSYLSNLTKTQLVIAEKLNETLTLGL